MKLAQQRLRDASGGAPRLLVGLASYPGQGELTAMAAEVAGTSGRQAGNKHKRKTYGRRLEK